MKTIDYKEAVTTVADHLYEDVSHGLDLEMQLGESNYDVWVYDKEIHVCKSTIDALTDGTYGYGSSSCPELKILFERDVNERIKDLKEASWWRNFEDTFTDYDWYSQTLIHPNYAY